VTSTPRLERRKIEDIHPSLPLSLPPSLPSSPPPSGIASGLVKKSDVYAEIGEVVSGKKKGREGDELILVDLTGTGAQVGREGWREGGEEGRCVCDKRLERW